MHISYIVKSIRVQTTLSSVQEVDRESGRQHVCFDVGGCQSVVQVKHQSISLLQRMVQPDRYYKLLIAVQPVS